MRRRFRSRTRRSSQVGRTHQLIRRAAQEWHTNLNDSDLLFRGTRLATTEEWVEHHPGLLDRLEQRFVDESIAARIAQEESEVAAAARSQRVRRRATVALASLTVASIFASIVAFSAFRNARESADRAEQNFATALSTSALGLAQSDPIRALLLAVESIERTGVPTTEARSALVQARLAFSGTGVVPSSPSVSTPGGFRVALRPDGRIAAVAESTGPVRLYDTSTGENIGDVLEGHTSGPRSLDFTSDGKTLISGSSDGLVLQWDLSVPDDVPEPETVFASDDVVWAIDISPDNRSVMVASDAGTLHEFDLATLDETRMLEWTGGAGIVSVAYSPDGSRVVASNRGGRLQSWLASGDEPLWAESATPSGPNLWEIVFSPDGNRFVTGGDRDVAHIHDASTGQAIAGVVFGERTGEDTAVRQPRGLAFSRDGSRLIGGTASGAVHTWAIDDASSETTSQARHDDVVEHGDISADGSVYASIGDDKRLRVWRVLSGVPSVDFADFSAGAVGVDFDPVGQRLAVGDGDGGVHIVDLATGERTTKPDSHRVAVLDVAWAHDGESVASLAQDGEVLIWAFGGSEFAGFLAGGGSDGSIEFSPDDRLVVVAGAREGEAGSVQVWDRSESILVADLPGHRQGARAAVFSADGESIATADGAGTIRLWSVSDFSLVREWQASDRAEVVAALDFSTDGLLASVDSSEDVRVWDPSTGRQVGMTVSGLDTGGAQGVGFTADGTSVAVLSRSGKLYLIDWLRGVNLASVPIAAHAGDFGSWDLDFAPDGATFATVGPDGFVKVWDLLSVEAACSTAGRALDPLLDADVIDDVEPIGCRE